MKRVLLSLVTAMTGVSAAAWTTGATPAAVWLHAAARLPLSDDASDALARCARVSDDALAALVWQADDHGCDAAWVALQAADRADGVRAWLAARVLDAPSPRGRLRAVAWSGAPAPIDLALLTRRAPGPEADAVLAAAAPDAAWLDPVAEAWRAAARWQAEAAPPAEAATLLRQAAEGYVPQGPVLDAARAHFDLRGAVRFDPGPRFAGGARWTGAEARRADALATCREAPAPCLRALADALDNPLEGPWGDAPWLARAAAMGAGLRADAGDAADAAPDPAATLWSAWRAWVEALPPDDRAAWAAAWRASGAATLPEAASAEGSGPGATRALSNGPLEGPVALRWLAAASSPAGGTDALLEALGAL
jgi:hypothetical protein